MSKDFAKVEQSISDGRSANKLRSFSINKITSLTEFGSSNGWLGPVRRFFRGGRDWNAAIHRQFVVSEICAPTTARRLSKYDTGSPVFPSGQQWKEKWKKDVTRNER